MGTTAIKAGEAFVRIFSDDTDLVRGLKGIEARLAGVGDKLTSVGGGVAALGAGITAMGAAMVAPFAAGVQQFTEFGSELADMSQRTGITAAALSELGYAAQLSGASLSDVESGVKKMQRSITELGDGSKSAAKTFDSLGLTLADLQGLSPDQQFEKVAAAIAAIEDPTVRAARAMEVFGKSGTTLLPLIISDLKTLRKQAEELGVTITEEDTNAAEELGDAFDKIGIAGKAIFLQLGAAVAEPLTRIVNKGIEIVATVNDWVRNNRGVVASVAAIGAGLIGVGGVVATVGGGIVALGATIAGVGTIATAVGGVITAVGAPILATVAAIGAAVTAVGAGFVYVAHQAGLVMPIINILRDGFGDLWGTAGQTFSGILSALGSGEFGLAAQVAWAGVNVATLQGIKHMLRAIEFLWDNAGKMTVQFHENLIKITAETFMNLPSIAERAFRGAFGGVQVYLDSMAGIFSKNVDVASAVDPLIDAAQSRLDSLTLKLPKVEASPLPDAAMGPAVAALGDGIGSSFDNAFSSIPTPPPSQAFTSTPMPAVDPMAGMSLDERMRYQQDMHFAMLAGESMPQLPTPNMSAQPGARPEPVDFGQTGKTAPELLEETNRLLTQLVAMGGFE